MRNSLISGPLARSPPPTNPAATTKDSTFGEKADLHLKASGLLAEASRALSASVSAIAIANLPSSGMLMILYHMGS